MREQTDCTRSKRSRAIRGRSDPASQGIDLFARRCPTWRPVRLLPPFLQAGCQDDQNAEAADIRWSLGPGNGSMLIFPGRCPGPCCLASLGRPNHGATRKGKPRCQKHATISATVGSVSPVSGAGSGMIVSVSGPLTQSRRRRRSESAFRVSSCSIRARTTTQQCRSCKRRRPSDAISFRCWNYRTGAGRHPIGPARPII